MLKSHHSVSLLAAAILLSITVCCKKESKFAKDDMRYFTDLLKAGMDSEDVINALGEPTIDLNKESAYQDGLHIYQYTLSDSSFVRIGVTDKITYACLVDSRNNYLEELVLAN